MINNNSTTKNKKRQPQDLMGKYTDKKIMMTSDQVFQNIINSEMTTKTGIRVLDCSTRVVLVSDVDMEKKKVRQSNNCKNRFCAICAWRKARKEAVIISVVMNYIKSKEKKEFCFLTLTAPNVSKEGLKSEINKFNKAFKKMFERKAVKAMNKGYVRKLEITYNKNILITEDYYNRCKDYCDRKGLKVGDSNPNYDTYHLHFHVIIAVNKTYFSGRTYIKQDIWLQMWRECMDDYTITQVDIRRVREKQTDVVIDGKKKNVVFEVAKYSAKDTDMHYNEDTFDAFYNALKGRQLITYNGFFKDVIKHYKEYIKIKDATKRELHFLHKYLPEDPNKYIYQLLYQWGHGEYVEKEKRLLTKEEQKELNKMIVDENTELEDKS